MLTKMMPFELDAELIAYYDEAIATDDDCGGVDLVSEGIYKGHLDLWCWRTDKSTMIIITQVKHYPNGAKDLLVLMLAGDGGIEDWNDCTKEFANEICYHFGCRQVIAFVKAKLWEIFKDAGAGENVDELYMVIGRKPEQNEELDN